MDMNGKVVVTHTMKGGPGKSTIVRHLAGVLVHTGASVIVIDGDNNKTSQKFFTNRSKHISESEKRGEKPIPFIKCEYKESDSDIRHDLRDLKKRYDYILVDAQGTANTLWYSSLQIADIVLVPTTPHPEEFVQVPDTLKVIREFEKSVRMATNVDDYSIDVRVIVNRIVPNSKSLREFNLLKKRYMESGIQFTSTSIPLADARFGAYEVYFGGLTFSDIKSPQRATFQLLAKELFPELAGRGL